MARAKKATKLETTSVVEAKEPVKVNVEKEYEPYDLIKCRSVTAGELYIGSTETKSGNLYIFSDVDEVVEIEYQDLLNFKQKHSPFLYKPTFIIEDDEFLKQPRWGDVAKLYTQIANPEEIKKILTLNADALRKFLQKTNPTIRRTVVDVATEMLENKSLDSIGKIQVIDEICGTELYKLAFN